MPIFEIAALTQSRAHFSPARSQPTQQRARKRPTVGFRRNLDGANAEVPPILAHSQSPYKAVTG